MVGKLVWEVEYGSKLGGVVIGGMVVWGVVIWYVVDWWDEGMYFWCGWGFVYWIWFWGDVDVLDYFVCGG